MTAEDDRLNPSILMGKTDITLYRLARTKYANLSGVGAAISPGRWNGLGQEAIYTSTEISVPVLERLVHTPKNTIPSNLSMMRITLKCDWRAELNSDHGVAFFQPSGARVLVFETLGEARRRFQKDGFYEISPVIAVFLPSVIVPVWNVVLYPFGWAFWQHVELNALEPFSFDPRFFPEDVPFEQERIG